MKIASYVKNGKRYDIVLPELTKGVLIPIPFSKGGPGSGRYPLGSGKHGQSSEDTMNRLEAKGQEDAAKQGAMDMMRDDGTAAAMADLERIRAEEKGLAEGPGGLEIGDIVTADNTEVAGGTLPGFEGRIVGKEGDNYVLENSNGYQATYPRDKIEFSDDDDGATQAAKAGASLEYGRIDKESMMDRRIRIEDDLATLEPEKIKEYAEEIRKPGMSHEAALANITQEDAGPEREDRGFNPGR